MQIQERPGEALIEGSKSSLESHGLYRLGLNYGRQVYRLRWYLIAFWIIIVLASIPFAARIGSVLTGGGYSYNKSESARAQALIQTKLPPTPTQLLVVFQSTSTPVSDPRYHKEVNDFITRARSFSNVTGVNQGGTGQDERTTYVTINFNVGSDT